MSTTKYFRLMTWTLTLLSLQSCVQTGEEPQNTDLIAPTLVSQKTRHDTDDPAIWINKKDPEKSLILGTDKDADGALYVFDIEGKIIEDKVVRDLQRPNNVDVEYGLGFGDSLIDIAVVTERLKSTIRVFRLPDMAPIDGGGIPVFEGEPSGDFQAPMGISLYHSPKNDRIYALVGRKNGPKNGYIWQYELKEEEGQVKAVFVRSFGTFSGKKEIESIAVDDSTGFVYYSDETEGVRKYHAEPDSGNKQLALFAREGFAQDNEGISIYPTSHSEGYILVSDQAANQFHVFSRENPKHPLLAVLDLSTSESDGSDVTPVSLGQKFPKGLFVAMSDDKSFQFYSWETLLDKILEKKKLGMK